MLYIYMNSRKRYTVI